MISTTSLLQVVAKVNGKESGNSRERTDCFEIGRPGTALSCKTISSPTNIEPSLDTRQRNKEKAASEVQPQPRDRQREAAAFWIPQATPDGRVFNFNTLTGESSRELPSEARGPDEQSSRDDLPVMEESYIRQPGHFNPGTHERVHYTISRGEEWTFFKPSIPSRR